jgi:mitotic spindle assembly checkpoint protein MAD2B
MGTCFQDITVEFLAVAFHNILYYTSVYPKNVFETRRKYNVVVYTCTHPEVIQYISSCLKSARECLKTGYLYRIVLAITNNIYEPIIKFVFDINKCEQFDENADAYLIMAEQNLRAYCLNLVSNTDKFKCLPEDCSFTIHLHTNESTAVNIALCPALEDFPMVEVDEISKDMENIIPLRSFPIRSHQLETYIEL